MIELRALTGARGVAAWFVVLYHVRDTIAGLPPAAEAILAKGYLAVDYFFVLSGFVIWLAWHDRLRQRHAVAAFLMRRVARIWPLHIAMLACAVALALALRASGRDDPAFPFDTLPFHAVLVQTWGLVDPLAWNDPAWSISAEAAAYLLFPLLALAIDWRRCATPTLLAVAAAILLLLHVAMRGAPTLGSEIARFGVLRCLCEFAVGGIVCALWLRWRTRAAVPAVAAVVAGLAALALGAPETLVVPATFAALQLALAATADRPRNPLASRMIHRLGEISYATYLSHFLLWKSFKLAFVVGPTINPPLLASYLALVLVASIILYETIEIPAQRRINRLASPRTRRAPTPR